MITGTGSTGRSVGFSEFFWIFCLLYFSTTPISIYACVSRPEHLHGVKDEVKKLEVEPQRGLLVCNIFE